MNLQDLKKGDEITIIYGARLRKARVVENFPKHEKIELSIDIDLWGLIRDREIKNYDAYNFEMLK